MTSLIAPAFLMILLAKILITSAASSPGPSDDVQHRLSQMEFKLRNLLDKQTISFGVFMKQENEDYAKWRVFKEAFEGAGPAEKAEKEKQLMLASKKYVQRKVEQLAAYNKTAKEQFAEWAKLQPELKDIQARLEKK